MHSYRLEFILNTQEVSPEALKNSMVEFGENIMILPLPQELCTQGRDFMIHLSTQDPAIIFDTCAQFGRLKSVKIEEVK